VLGNPPYIRAERVKYGEEMRDLWAHVWGQNSDTGLIFLYRALTEWLEPGGFLGMVVSGGYANSEAAAKVWSLLQPGGQAALRHVVWLEFAGKLWEPNVIPMLLVVERTEAAPDDEIMLHVPAEWPGSDAPHVVRYADFWDKRVSPNGANPLSLWGNYLLPLLTAEDVPILRRLYPEGQNFVRLGEIVKWTYGIQRGGVELTSEPVGDKPIPVIAGRSLAVAWPGEPAGWVDLAAVEKRPYGKPSLWRGPVYPDKFIAVAKFGLAPFASVVEAQGRLAGLDTTTVAGTYDVRPEAAAAYLNSSLVRFYWAVRLRAGVLEGSSRATIYPRSLEGLPWPKNLTPTQEQALAADYNLLAGLAARAKDNPNEWLLAEAERRSAVGHLRLSDPRLGLTFAGGADEVKAGELRHEGNAINTEAAAFALFSNADAAEYVYRLLTLTLEEDMALKAADMQKLVVPADYAALMAEYRRRWAGFESVEQDFRAALVRMDATVYDAFGITEPEQAHISQRLNSFPLNRLQPRYPWQAVKPRPIKAYMADRFA
ncbi:MAG: N-6 DNA methylase, partial [Armatimonadota bacterium]|nr:N-6 DNA methylase [Armatimonadota bacterium]